MREYRHLRTSVLILVVLGILALIGMGMFKSENDIGEAVWAPINAVSEREGVYALTINVESGSSLDELMRFAELTSESKIPVCFFFSERFFSVNGESAKKIAAMHEVGLLIDENTEYMSRGETLRFLAKINEQFFEKVGKYPRYVRSTKTSQGFLPHILDAYGQYGIAAVDPSAAVSDGSIVDMGAIDSTTSARAVALVTKAAKNDLDPTPLRELLYSVDIKPDIFGVQHGQ